MIVFEKKSRKVLEKMDRKTRDRIMSKIKQLESNRDALAGQIKWIAAYECHRLRVGDWRVFFTDDGRVLAIIKISPRGSAYQD